MSEIPLSTLVLAVQQGAGDLSGVADAYAEIVRRFEGMARAIGLRWLGDAQRAEDVAQEAFIEAYLTLGQLRDPHAFPGWFRRIVLKQCDRQLRHNRREQPLADWLPLADGGPDVLNTLYVRERVNAALENLPERQRTLTRLFYFEGYSQQEIVEQLRWPLSTVKKQLYLARNTLREEMSDMAEMSKTTLLTEPGDLPLRVRFFLALRARDAATIRQLAQTHPELLDARTEWAELENNNFWPLGYTALHYAVALGDHTLADALIAAGADVNALTKSQFATPLHVAVMMQRPDMIATLLAAGANVGAANYNGMTALHFAAHRGELACAQALLAAGAAHSLKDAGGHTPLDWAQHRSNPAVAEALRAQGASAAAPPAQPVPAVDRGQAFFESGIKIVDLFAPIKRGAANTLFTPLTGIGKVVQLEQFIDTVTRRYAGVSHFLGVEYKRYTGNDFALELRDSGLSDAATLHYGALKDAPSLAAAVDATLSQLDPSRETLILADAAYAEDEGMRAKLEGALRSPTAHGDNHSAVTLIWFGEHSVGAEPVQFAEAPSRLTFDMWRALNGFWPAIDPLRSQSACLTGRHAELIARAKRLLRRYEDLRVVVERDPRGVEAFESAEDRLNVARARRLHAYLSQPFPMTELFTNTYGEYVPLAWALDGLEAVLEGRADELSEGELRRIANTRRYVRR